MSRKSPFIQACEALKGSKNFKTISERSLKNFGEKSPRGNFEKFKEGARNITEWLEKTYNPKSHI